MTGPFPSQSGSTAATPSTIRVPREPIPLVPISSTWKIAKGNTEERKDLSMIEPVLLAGRECNIVYLSDTSNPKELENIRCDLFLPEQARYLYHFRMPPSQLPTHLSPQIVYLVFHSEFPPVDSQARVCFTADHVGRKKNTG